MSSGTGPPPRFGFAYQVAISKFQPIRFFHVHPVIRFYVTRFYLRQWARVQALDDGRGYQVPIGDHCPARSHIDVILGAPVDNGAVVRHRFAHTEEDLALVGKRALAAVNCRRFYNPFGTVADQLCTGWGVRVALVDAPVVMLVQ